MSARVICLAGVKGGSGTTTLVAALGRLLASAGLRTLLIDADLQGCGLTIMHLDYVLAARSAALNAPCGLAEAADAERNADACILETSLALIPSAYTAPAAARGCEPALERALVETLHASRASYDYVLVDAPACVTPFGQRIGRLADDLVLVAAYDALAVAALSRVEAVLDADGSSRPTWVLPNKAYFPAPATVSGLLDGYRWLPPIPYYRAVALAGARREVALADDGPDPFAWCLLRAFAELDARLPAVVRDRAGWDVAELRRAWRVEHARAGATLNELERRRVRLESSLRGENGGPTIGFRLVIALVAAVAPCSWALVFALHGTRPEWRAAAYLLIVGGLALAAWVWRYSDLRGREFGDSVEQLLELETVRESQRELRARIRELEPVVLWQDGGQ